MSDAAKYGIPAGVLGLKAPTAHPGEGSLPIRGDLAHIALADRYLVAHYVEPQIRTIGSGDTQLLLQPQTGSEAIATLPAGSTFEALDFSGDWCWGCIGADGPAGYVRTAALAPLSK